MAGETSRTPGRRKRWLSTVATRVAVGSQRLLVAGWCPPDTGGAGAGQALWASSRSSARRSLPASSIEETVAPL